MNPIRITLHTPAGARRKTFKTALGASLYAQDMVGETPAWLRSGMRVDGATWPAVTENGVALCVEGITLGDLFPLATFPDCFPVSA